ncbi:MAG: hypothetical protein LBP65_02935 [Puniceicoccales bacterium]|jgi:hypothetical protein|nr:hypothetical protein [Puniceicoccales bacterium]
MQVTFSAASLAVLESLPQLQRVALIGLLGDLRREQFSDAGGPFGTIHRRGRALFRVRMGDLRLYFSFADGGVHCDHILTRHTFEDFCFRCRLPAGQDVAENSPLFWQLVENESGDGGPRAQ